MEEPVISEFKDDNFASIVELMQTTYPGHEISDERYLYWEYARNPDGKALMNIASAKGKVISQYAVIPRQFVFRGKTLMGSVSVNTITHPDFRGRNLFPLLVKETFRQCSERDILFTIGFPNPISLPVIKKKEIFTVAGSLSVLFKPINPVASLIRYFGSKKEKSGGDIPLAISIKDNSISKFDIASSSVNYNQLLNHFNKREFLTTNRSIDFFKWRYIDIPRRTYYSLSQGSGELNGVIVFRSKYIYGIRCLVIVDIIAKNQEAVRKLVNEVNRIAKDNRIDLLFSAVTVYTDEYETLRSAGYFSLPDFILPQKLAFIVKKHRSDCPDDIMHFGNWFLTFGDYDIF